MQIVGLNKTTLLDYPGLVAATIFTGGCNFCCPFCHNGDLVLRNNALPPLSSEEIFTFLKKRKGILAGVCITGGEPTLQKDLSEFIEKVKALDLKVKLDTNGYHPEVIENLLKASLIDYIAMDIKASKQNYSNACGICNLNFSNIEASVSLLQNASIPYEFRTTVVKGIHTADDFYEIADWLSGSSPYFLQSYKESDGVIQKGYQSFSNEELQQFYHIVKNKMKNVSLRGID